MAPLKRALISCSDKTGVEDLASALAARDIEILSTGGTAQKIRDAKIPVTDVSDVTKFPEILGGRVKTLHPMVHGGLLARLDDEKHRDELAEHGIRPIGLVAVNLYPFRETVAKPDHTLADAIEKIDIGGPTMVRAAAKNYAHVAVVVDPADYPRVLAEIEKNGEVSERTRFELAVKAFDHVAAYDDAISDYLSSVRKPDQERDEWPEMLNLQWRRKQTLRYGENPHQKAAFYVPSDGTPEGLGDFEQLHGKELSYNNLMDVDGAVRLVSEFDDCACAIIKHSNPAGCAYGKNTEDAFRRALTCDPISAFGGIIAFNRKVDAPAAAAVIEKFYEVVIAPDFAADALETLKKKKNLRLLRMPNLVPRSPQGNDIRRVVGGVLFQSWDDTGAEADEAKVVTKRKPSDAERRDIAFAWRVCKHVKSNAVVFVKDGATVGVGAGQMSRVDSVRLAAEKAAQADLDLAGSVLASDAFFPFRDGLDAAASAGAKTVVQPGGSVRDEEVIAAADEHEIAMVFTGVRHFRH